MALGGLFIQSSDNGEDRTQFERVIVQENIHCRLNKEEIAKVKLNPADPDCRAYMEAPASKFEYTWPSIADTSPWMPQASVSQPVDDGTKYKDQIFTFKDEVLHAVKTFS